MALGFVYYFTKEDIANVEANKLNKALGEVLPQFDHQNADTVKGEALDLKFDPIVYTAFDSNNQRVGAAVKTQSDGFGGKIELLVGFDNDGKIFGYSVLKHSETAGLGSKMDKWFQADGKGNVIGKDMANGELKVRKDKGDVDAITAATISSRAFCVALNNAYKVFVSMDSNASTEVEQPTATEQPAAAVENNDGGNSNE